MLIANDGPLGPEWLDYPLKGDWEGHRECHIGVTSCSRTRLMTAGKIGGFANLGRKSIHATPQIRKKIVRGLSPVVAASIAPFGRARHTICG